MPTHASHKSAAVSASDGIAIKAPACRTEILVRLWTRTGEGKKLLPDEANSKRQGAIAFIEDVIASKKGVLVSTEDGLFVSVLERPADALVVSRQILLGMRGFQDKSADRPVSVSISLDVNLQDSIDEAHTESSSENSDAITPALQASPDLSSLIRISRPAQVLLTHDLIQQVNRLKGLPLKPFQGRFGVSEYLWTSEAKLLEYQDQQSGFVDLIEAEQIEKTIPQLEPSAAVESHFEPGAERALGSRTIQNPAWKRILFTPWGIAAVATVVMALVVTGGIALRSKKPAPAPQRKAVIQVPTPSNPQPKIPPATPTAGTTAQQTTNQQPPVVIAQNPQTKPEAPKTKGESTPDPKKKAAFPLPKTECSTSSGELQTYVHLGEDRRGHGDYVSAERLFKKVLDCDPNNQDARRGLERTRAAEASAH